MSRQPFCTPKDVRGSNFFHTYENASAVERIFNQEIFPEGTLQFNRADLKPDLYISKRIWCEYINLNNENESDRYETLIHKLFWDEKQPKTLCVIADVGVGKSTLINYYLRCYCPALRPKDFRKKLLLLLDAKTLSLEGGIVRNLYYKIKNVIESAYKERSFTLNVKGGSNIYDWVRGAFNSIESSRNTSNATFEYVVLFLDNLDQCDPDDQKRLVREIHSWNDTYPKLFHRIIFTFWPATLLDLTAPDMVLLRSSTQITVGALATECHIDRLNALNITLSGLSANNPINQASDYATYLFESLKTNNVLQIIRGLTNGDLRRELRILSDYLYSEECHNHWVTKRHISQHDALLGTLLGRKDYFYHNVSRIANILLLGHAVMRPRDILVGWHLLEMLTRATTKKSLFKTMMALGYAEENILKAIDNAWKMNLFHRSPSRSFSDEDYYIHSDSITAYRQLASMPAYVDCISVTTPVTDDVREKMQQMVDNSKGDRFVACVSCVIEFIRSIRRDEKEFLDIKTNRKDLDYQQFADTLNKHKIHLLWKRMAHQYWGRLNGLRLSGTLPSIKDSQWDEWLSSDVLVDFRTPGEFMET